MNSPRISAYSITTVREGQLPIIKVFFRLNEAREAYHCAIVDSGFNRSQNEGNFEFVQRYEAERPFRNERVYYCMHASNEYATVPINGLRRIETMLKEQAWKSDSMSADFYRDLWRTIQSLLDI